jgi:VIT1/CCC1 family predicted Fe2+/Mn2+ transporter
MFEKMTKQWTAILEFGILVVSAVAFFVITPPRLTPAAESGWIHAAEFIGAILIVIIAVAVRHQKTGVRALLIATSASLLTAVIALFGYSALVQSWTCSDYDGRGPITTGSQMLTESAAYAARTGRSGCKLIQDYAGDTTAIWNSSELAQRHLIMVAAFIMSVLLFVTAALFAVETVRAWTEGAPAS